MNEVQLEKDLLENLFVLNRKTVEILLLECHDALILYLFYYKTAKIQKTNQVFATKEFCKKGLGFGSDKFYKAKKILEKYNLIEQIKVIDEKTKQVKAWYVKINYIRTAKNVESIINESQSTQNQSTQKPEGGKQSTNALSKRTKMLKVKEVNALSKRNCFDDFWNSYPKKVNKKTTQDLWIKNKLDLKVKEILKFVEYAKLTERWKLGYVKAPDVFIRGENWNDDLTQYGSFKKQDNKYEVNLGIATKSALDY